MATKNFTSSANRANVLYWSYSTKMVNVTDRKTTSRARGAEGTSINNLGIFATATNPFTILA